MIVDKNSLDASGNLLVGQTLRGGQNSNSFDLDVTNGIFYQNHINGTSSGTSFSIFLYNDTVTGSITQSGTTAVAYNTSSDYRLKNITGPITNSGAYIDQRCA